MQFSPSPLKGGVRRLPSSLFPFFFALVLLGNITLDASTEIQKLLGSSLEESSRFGGSISKSGDTLIVGAYRDNQFKGSAYVFIKEGEVWVEQAKLTASDGEAHERFGASVLVDGNWAFVGAPEKNTVNYADEGCVYLFQRTGDQWSEVGKLFGSIGGHSSNFGVRMALEGDTLMVGASGYTGDRFNSGAVYVFERSGEIWNETQFLTASREIVNARFGGHVSISGDHALISAGDGGYVFIKEEGQWVEEVKLFPSDNTQDDRFGQSGVIAGNVAVVGAPGVDGTATTSGAAYVFEKEGDTWVEHAKLLPDRDSHDFNFGSSVSIQGGLIAVGADRTIIPGNDTGSVSLFEQKGDSWVAAERLIPDGASDQDSFGSEVLIAGDSLYVSSVEDDDAGEDSGAVYSFNIEIQESAPAPPEILFFTASGPALELDDVSFSVGAIGNSFPLSYVWQISMDEGVTWKTLSDSHEAAYTIPVVYQHMDGHLIRVIVSGYGGSTVSEAAQVRVNLPIPRLTNFTINGGDLATEDRNISISGSFFGLVPTEFRVSENEAFSDATWQPFIVPQSFTLSEGFGLKTIYYQGRNANGSSEVLKRTISLNAPLTEVGRYVSSNTFFSQRDGFGHCIALSDSWLFVGAPGDDDNTGSVYVFKLVADSWIFDSVLSSPNSQPDDRFGESLAYENGVLVVGAPEHVDGRGGAYIFEWEEETWVERTKIIGSDLGSDDRFGASVAISGDSILVGADEFTEFHSRSGRAYVFIRSGDNWTEQGVLMASDSSDGAYLGGSVSIEGDNAIVYATKDEENKGSAYLFTRSEGIWTEQIKYLAPDGVEGLNDGWIGFVSGQAMFIGPEDSGIYFYDHDGTDWNRGTLLTAHVDEPYYFKSLDINDSGDTIIVGGLEGTAFLFTKDGPEWVQRTKLSSGNNNFGIKVDLKEDLIAVTQAPGSNSGTVHLYDLGEGATIQAPAFIFHPQDMTVEEDQAANFQFSAVGGVPFDFQWEVSDDGGINWTVLEGETFRELEIRNTRADQSSTQFRVAVANSSGTEVSESATLTVIPKEGSPELSDFRINEDAGLTFVDEVTLDFYWWGPQPTEYRVSESFDFSDATWLPFAESPLFTVSPGFGSKFVYTQLRNEAGESDIRSDGIEFSEEINPPQLTTHRVHPDRSFRASRFGTSVSVSGDWAVAGDPNGNSPFGRTGSVSVFSRELGEWARVATLYPNDGEGGEGFGQSVAVDNETIVVGAPRDIENEEDVSTGSAYVFGLENGQWIQKGKLRPDNLEDRFEFGERVAISEDTIVIGASGISIHPGTAYVYVRDANTWSIQSQLLASDGALNDRFGSGVAIDGDTILVGSSNDLVNGISTGSAYVFERAGESWSELSKLLAEDGLGGDGFGQSLSLYQNTAIIGASGSNDNGGSSGSAYIFDRTGDSWDQVAKLLPSDGYPVGRFGTSVAVEDTHVLVGATGGSRDQGGVYLFQRSGNSWSESAKLRGDSPGERDEFGRSVALSGNTGMVGASRDPGETAYLFEIPESESITQSPGITVQPENLWISAPEPATFSVTAFGSQPIEYQWEMSADNENWEVISGATNSDYLIDPTGIDIHNTFYRAVISNAFGSITSDTVSLAVEELLAPELFSVGFANEALETTTQVVTVGLSSTSGVITQFRISEQLGFAGAEWRDLPFDPSFKLSSGFGEKTVYLQVRNDAGESEVQSASILYRPANPTSFEPVAKLRPLNDFAGQYFGEVLSISGNTAVVGVRLDNENGDFSGAVYVFERVNGIWGDPVKLLAEDGEPADFFGRAVALDGDTIVVLASGDDDSGDGVGSGYVYLRDGDDWTLQDKLLINDPVIDKGFGTSVAISGDVIVVGLANDHENGYFSGGAYVFEKAGDNWIQEAKLLPDDGGEYDRFGTHVAINGLTLVVGAPGGGSETIESGAAYVYRRDAGGWTLDDKLIPLDGRHADQFGTSVTIKGESIAIGSPNKDLDFDEESLSHRTRDGGGVYLFEYLAGKWSYMSQLVVSNRESREEFGTSVALGTDILVVGAQSRRIDNSEAGSTFLYQRNREGYWNFLSELERADYGIGDQFGISVAVTGAQILVGASWDDLRRGSAYIYDVESITSNTAPALVHPSDQTVDELESLIFNLEASDIDDTNEELEFSFVGPSFGATLNPVSGAFSWSPEEGQGPSSYQFVVQVSDGYATDTANFTVHVDAVFESLEDWLMDVFTSSVPSDSQNLAADFDFDGLTTLLEYVLGLDPEIHDSQDSIFFQVDEISGNLQLTTWLRGDPSTPVTVLVSNGLTSWTEVGITFDTVSGSWSTNSSELSIDSSVEIASGLWEITLQDEQGYGRMFVQLRVSNE